MTSLPLRVLHRLQELIALATAAARRRARRASSAARSEASRRMHRGSILSSGRCLRRGALTDQGWRCHERPHRPRARAVAAARSPPARRSRRSRAAAGGRADRRAVRADRPGRPAGHRPQLRGQVPRSCISATPSAPTSARSTCRTIGAALKLLETSDPALAREGRAGVRHGRSGARHARGAQAVRRRLPPAHGRADRHAPRRSPRSRRNMASIRKRGDAHGGGYMMDHSRQAYLMDPDGKPLALLPQDEGAAGDRRRDRSAGRRERTLLGRHAARHSSTAGSGRRCATAAANAASTSWRTRRPASWSRPTSRAACSTGAAGNARTIATAMPMSPNACG